MTSWNNNCIFFLRREGVLRVYEPAPGSIVQCSSCMHAVLRGTSAVTRPHQRVKGEVVS
jgi:hypothetical protein